jgi:hypothetical protein
MAQRATGAERQRSEGLSFCVAYDYMKKSRCAANRPRQGRDNDICLIIEIVSRRVTHNKKMFVAAIRGHSLAVSQFEPV